MANVTLKKSRLTSIILLVSICIIISLIFSLVQALPTGPSITILGNSTKSVNNAQIVNSTVNGQTPGGYIFTSNINSVQQDIRWKAYVGNVSGTLTLDDANDQTIYQWSLTTVTGRIFATRASGNVNWTGINCTWIREGVDNYSDSTRIAEEAENAVLSITTFEDNISSTFNKANHSSFVVAGKTIGKNECFSLQTYQNDREQVFSDSNQANFTEVILYDGAYGTENGNIIYETKIENDITGYRTDSTYDFQIMVPESGLLGFTSSTAYYFYIELT